MSSNNGHLVEFGDFAFDAATHSLWRNGELLNVTPKGLDVLAVLISRAGEVVTRDHLIEAVWPDTFVEEGNLNYTISLLRKTLGDADLIKTLPKRGYLFTAQVRTKPSSSIPDERAVRPAARSKGRRWVFAAVGVVAIVGLALIVRQISSVTKTEPPSPSSIPEAGQAYTRGRLILENRNVADREQKAIDEFQRAVRLDPTFALGYAGLAEAFTSAGNKQSGRESVDNHSKAKVAARKALSLDPNLPEGLMISGWIKYQADWDFAGAETDLRRASELIPNEALVHFRLSRVLSCLGQKDAALAEANRAYQLDPVSELVRSVRFAVLESRGEYDEGLAAAERFYKEDRENPQASRAYATFLFHKGNYARVIEVIEKGMQSRSKQNTFAWLSLLATAYARVGDQPRADDAMKQLQDLAASDSKALYSLAMNYAETGRTDEALAALEKCLNEREERMLWLKNEPRFVNLRSEPRFQQLAQKVGIA